MPAPVIPPYFNASNNNPQLTLNLTLTPLADHDVWDLAVLAPLVPSQAILALNNAAVGINSPISRRYSWPRIDRAHAFLVKIMKPQDIPAWWQDGYMVGLFLDENQTWVQTVAPEGSQPQLPPPTAPEPQYLLVPDTQAIPSDPISREYYDGMMQGYLFYVRIPVKPGIGLLGTMFPAQRGLS